MQRTLELGDEVPRNERGQERKATSDPERSRSLLRASREVVDEGRERPDTFTGETIRRSVLTPSEVKGENLGTHRRRRRPCRRQRKSRLLPAVVSYAAEGRTPRPLTHLTASGGREAFGSEETEAISWSELAQGQEDSVDDGERSDVLCKRAVQA